MILRENLESPVLRYQPITTAVVTDACLNTRWHHGAYTSAVLRESLGLDRVMTVYVELSWLATVQSGRKQVQSRVCTPSLSQPSVVSFFVRLLVGYFNKTQMNTQMYDFALRNITVNHIRGCVVKILYPTLPRFQSKMAIVWDRSIGPCLERV